MQISGNYMTSIKDKKFLVTGTAGFIGMHVARKLLQEGAAVIGIDNFNDYYDVSVKEGRHSQLEECKNYFGYRADLCDYDKLSSIFSENDFDVVIHLAAQAGVRYSLEHPFAYLKSNLEAFLNLLEMVRHNGPQRFVYASSSSVYGANKKLPFSEQDSVDTPVSLYAATKKADELMAYTYMHLYDIQTIGLRFFTVYGPWGRPDMAMWIFADKISRGETISVYNYGEMQRDFTFIDDIVDGVINSAIKSDLDQYEIFNLGNHRSEKLMDLIAEIEKGIGKKADCSYEPIQPGDVPATYADIDRAADKLDFKPETPLSKGVPIFIDWFKKYHGLD